MFKVKPVIVILSLLFSPIAVLAYISPGQPSGLVNDFAGLLSVSEISALQTKLSKLETESGNEVVVVTVRDLGGDTIENYASELFEDWGIGKMGRDNGVLLLTALGDRKTRIEIGYGLEGELTDIQGSQIINEIVGPAFRRGDYYGGLDRAADRIFKILKGETPLGYDGSFREMDFDFLFNFLFFGFFILAWLASILGRSKSWWAGGVVGGAFGVVASFIFGFLYFGLVSIILLISLGLLFDFLVSRAYSHGLTSSHIPWWAGGGHVSGGRDWFSGFGGGSSGGGGASGDW